MNLTTQELFDSLIGRVWKGFRQFDFRCGQLMPFEDLPLLPTWTHTLIGECCDSVRSLCQRSDPLSWRKHDTPSDGAYSWDSERDNNLSFPTTLDKEADSGSSDSQHTTSDKRSALSSGFRSLPFGRSATRPPMKSSASGNSVISSTSETRLPSSPVLRSTCLPIPWPQSMSAVEQETPRRQSFSFNSDRDIN